ncbi:Rieske (2Fe-2S) protein [Halalkalicoccus jeotgali]|uniref:Rieske (2Fe-2S) iron-sulfur domain protein n=1 Tax=Halalkalicoccus jeotgali (strain DSM 18796 / CECT 7217 / JCM 14584 / KCTC 4019 / B3) TaxID=795797 RepID=D8J6T1_HALJB|nr:Rieske (2Fe-2S) protein [Halalkalicoccus jeotgali]ADJ15884.1 Rieske (2Fe-2S) iron-sulfur domain protein [Halalkalicoccus jeotgali B3]ELY37981.1 Rieske (2Fe-2S) iron-sulfur domain-containing protein [Halalkalicoccus jeotgali B3]
MATTDEDFVQVATTADLDGEDQALVTTRGQAIALFRHEGEFYAVDNRCPHMGFPLAQGTVDDGVLTCHWHHARFELGCGSTFDPFADDLPTFPTEVRGEEIWVDPHPKRDDPPRERWLGRLEDGLENDLRLVLAKSVIGLDDADINYELPLERIATFGARYRDDGWGRGLTTMGAMANLLPALEPEDRRRALYTGAVSVANDASGHPPRFVQDPLSGDDHDPERLERWFRDCIEVRDRQGAERVLGTAIAHLPNERVVSMLVGAATDHRYLDTGHTVDFLNKAVETLNHVGWERADDLLPALVPQLASAERSEERSSWRQPVDLAALLSESFERLPARIGAGEREEWTPTERFDETLLSEDPREIVATLDEAIEAGASAADLADRVGVAAGVRIAQFGTGNEVRDWNTVHHTYTYANAVCGLARRTGGEECYKAVYDGAINVYLDRFLNTPPTPIPEPREVETDPETLLGDLLETFDEEGEVNRAGRFVADYLDSGGDPEELTRTLGGALLREDANFHTLQNVEAAFEQAERTGEKRLHLIATARYLAAHTPTRREREQTFTIATRLHRGEKLHESA